MNGKIPLDEKTVGAEVVQQSLQQVIKGAGLVFIGIILSILFGFVGRVIIARSYTQTNYGIFSLGFVIINIFVIVGTLGLHDGATRQIAYYRSKKSYEKIGDIISFSLLFGFSAGLILFIIVFLFSNIISINLFNLSSLSHPLKIFSVAIPFFVLINIFTAVFRGFNSVKEKVIFYDCMRTLSFVFFLLAVLWTDLSFEWVIVAFSISIITTSVLFILYFLLRSPIPLSKIFKIKKYNSIGKELLFFSLPLLIVTILYQIMEWTDTLMLGYFKPADIVGLYNAASPLGKFISAALTSILFIYMPIVSGLYAHNRVYEMKKSYAILTKWLCAGTFPLVAIFVFFPNKFLMFLFGDQYTAAASSLQILAIGFFINNIMGPNGATLTAIGKIKFLMWTTFAAAGVNIIFNILLIPRYSVEGAAIATITALIFLNIIRSIKLYQLSNIHSLEKNTLKPIFLSGILFLAIFIIIQQLFVVTVWMLPIFFIVFIVLFGASMVFTKSFDREDINMFNTIEKKVGINLRLLKDIVKKFI